jgi:hypothetical protein
MMFKKRKWIIISILAAAIIVAVGVGGAVYAKSNSIAATTTQTDPQKVFADKVAAILGADNATVEAAFTQAEKEMATERSAAILKAEEARIDQMVTDSKLTADQAAKMKTWLESKPDVNVPGLGIQGSGKLGGFGRANCGPGGMRGFGRGLPPGNGAAPTPTATTTN